MNIPTASPCNCFNPVQLLLRRQACQRPQRMNAEPPSLDGIAERQDDLLYFRGEVQEAEDLGHVGPRNAQLTGQISSGCSFSTAYSLVPFPG